MGIWEQRSIDPSVLADVVRDIQPYICRFRVEQKLKCDMTLEDIERLQRDNPNACLRSISDSLTTKPRSTLDIERDTSSPPLFKMEGTYYGESIETINDSIRDEKIQTLCNQILYDASIQSIYLFIWYENVNSSLELTPWELKIKTPSLFPFHLTKSWFMKMPVTIMNQTSITEHFREYRKHGLHQRWVLD